MNRPDESPKIPVLSEICLVCRNDSFQLIHQKKQWQYLRCRRCGLVSLYPRPTREDLLKDYDTYLPAQAENIVQWGRMMSRINRTSADLIEASAACKGRLLDIGCGYGFFLSEMQQRGWQTEGIEISAVGRAYARQTWNIRVHAETLEALTLPENHFDVVTLFYVIEHLLDPLSLLREVRRILKPGGLILLRWPHTAPMLKVLGPFVKNYDYFHTPFHLYDFSPATIVQLLDQAGFAGVATRIGGYSLPAKRLNRWFTVLCGTLAETLYSLSARKFLMPGVSKTTLARKPRIEIGLTG
ncbi:MAG: class I SAM-dependent methyltransferase [Desulfobacteraceae bacterium]|nr:MAG: class I SAM-dependent methyltransferase [Desulfobacteraceae bacterium]